MSLLTVLTIAHLIISLSLVSLVLIQSQSTGLSSYSSWGGGFYRSKRGLEKAILVSSVLLGALFAISSFFQVYLRG